MRTKTPAMPVEEILDLSNLHLPPYPEVKVLDWYDYTDHAGDPALRITVVLADNPRDDEPRWRDLKPIHDQIAETLIANGIDLFPYFRYIKEKEYLSEQAA